LYEACRQFLGHKALHETSFYTFCDSFGIETVEPGSTSRESEQASSKLQKLLRDEGKVRFVLFVCLMPYGNAEKWIEAEELWSQLPDRRAWSQYDVSIQM
jgi:hypothetical protein